MDDNATREQTISIDPTESHISDYTMIISGVMKGVIERGCVRAKERYFGTAVAATAEARDARTDEAIMGFEV